MSFLEERSATEKLGGVLLVMGIIIAIRLAWSMGLFEELVMSNDPDAIAERLEEEMLEEPVFAAMYGTMQAEFPEDYERFKDTMVEVVQDRGSSTDAFNAGKRFMQLFMQRNAEQFRSAPTPALLAARDASISTINLLALEGDSLCAHCAMSGLNPGDRPSPQALREAGEATSAVLLAVAAGRDNPVERGDPTEADINAYVDALSRLGMSDARIDDFLQGAFALMRESDAVQCEEGLRVYRALAQLPDESAARISAVMLLPVQ